MKPSEFETANQENVGVTVIATFAELFAVRPEAEGPGLSTKVYTLE